MWWRWDVGMEDSLTRGVGRSSRNRGTLSTWTSSKWHGILDGPVLNHETEHLTPHISQKNKVLKEKRHVDVFGVLRCWNPFPNSMSALFLLMPAVPTSPFSPETRDTAPPHKLFDYLVCFRSPGIEMALIGEKPNPNNPVVFFDITVGNMVRMQWFQDSVKVGYFFVLKYTGNIRIHAHRFCWSNHGSLKYEPFVDQCFLLLSLIAALLLFQEIGRIKFELFADVVPRTAENFRLV